MGLRSRAGRGNMRPTLVANLPPADLLTQVCPLVEQGPKGGDSDLGDLPQLQAEVASFLQCSPKTAKEDSKGTSLEPPISQHTEWVQWKAEKCEVPDWYAELSTVPLEDTKMLAWQVRASFQAP